MFFNDIKINLGIMGMISIKFFRTTAVLVAMLFSSFSAHAQVDLIIPPSTPTCEVCDGKIDNIIFRYSGEFPSFIEIQSRKGKRFATLYAGFVSVDQQFSISGADNFLDKKSTLGPTIYISVNGGDPIALHTSCSVPIGPGTTAGDLVVLTATSRNGGLTCPVDDTTPPTDPNPPTTG
jgi:hypothetical protein